MIFAGTASFVSNNYHPVYAAAKEWDNFILMSLDEVYRNLLASFVYPHSLNVTNSLVK